MWRRGLVFCLALWLVMACTSVATASESFESGSFSPAGPLAEARTGHTATVLSDGRVLVVGGHDGSARYRALAEVWDPLSGTFSPAGSLTAVRAGHTATILSDGRVLVAGGWGTRGPLASAEIWDPQTATFEPTGSPAEARVSHTANLLPDGRVLVVGGWGDDHDPQHPYLATAEAWDPLNGTFSPAGSLTEARGDHTATLLPDGRVLVMGGRANTLSGPFLATTEVWDPVSKTFEPTVSLLQERAEHAAALLPDGRVFIVGGYDGNSRALTSTETWDPLTGTFGATGALEGTPGATATLLPDGRVLAVGGDGAEVWDPGTGTFGPAGALGESRSVEGATLLPDGRVFIVGGWGDDVVFASAEVWEPSSVPNEAEGATE